MAQLEKLFGNYPIQSTNRFYHRAWADDYLYAITKKLIKDPLWRGRFYVRRLKSEFELFHDHSGGLLFITIRIFDKKTRKYKDISTDCMDMQIYMFEWINNFIVNEVKVWENEDPYNDHTDWRVRK